MVWKPTNAELDVIADMTTARMPLDRIVMALAIAPADFLAWRATVVATAVAEEFSSCPPLPRRVRRGN